MAKDHLGPFGTSPWMENVECQKGENLSKMWKFVENVNVCQKCENLFKMWKLVKNVKIC